MNSLYMFDHILIFAIHLKNILTPWNKAKIQQLCCDWFQFWIWLIDKVAQLSSNQTTKAK